MPKTYTLDQSISDSNDHSETVQTILKVPTGDNHQASYTNGGYHADEGADVKNGAANGGAFKGDEVDVFKGEGEGSSNDAENEAEAKKTATFAEMFSFASCPDVFLIFLGFLCAAAHGSSWPLLFLIFGNMSDALLSFNVTGNYTFDNTTDPGKEFEDEMTKYAIQYSYIGAGVFAVTYVHIAFAMLSGERQTFRLRKAFFLALLRQSIGWYDEKQSGELTTRLADDLERVKEGLGDKLSLVVQFLSQFVAGFVLGFVKGWKLTLVIMSLTPLLAFCASLMGKVMATYSAREQTKYAKAGAIAEEVLSCIRTVISFNGHRQEISRYSDALEESRKLGIKKSVMLGLNVGVTMLIMFCAYGLAFWYGSRQVNDYNESMGEDGISPGSVFSVFFSVMIGSFALGSAGPHITSVLTAKGSAGTIFSIIKNRPEIDASSTDGKTPTAGIKGNIEFKGVTFAYPTRKEIEVLKEFDLSIQAGQTVALVGASGCGKSTIINLIQRFYDPEAGQISLDGEDLRDLNLSWLRNNIGVVSQEPILFGMSIADNIALGRPDVTQEEIRAAAVKANAHDFVSRLPQGYSTLVGERGAQLSGGQKQRVAIARALVRDPKILLLDEATSALDSEAEGIVQAALDKAREGRTTIVVAHRLSTIQNADHIYVMDGGHVVESGRHIELMERKGAYYHLVALQTIAEEKGEHQGDANGLVKTGRAPSDAKNPARQLSKQSSVDGASPKRANLFRSKSSKSESEEDEDKDVPRPGFGRMMKSNLQEWPFILFGTCGAAANGAIMPVFAIFFSEVFKTFGETGQKLLDDGLFWGLMYVALGGLAFFANVIQNSAFGVSGERLTKRLRAQTFTNILRQDVEYFDNPKHNTGALTTRLATDASMVKVATGFRLSMIVQSMTAMIAGMVIAFVFGWKLALLVLGMAPVLLISGALNMKLLKGNQERDAKLLEDAGKTASECVENIRTVQALTREPYFYDKYCQQLLKPHRENMKQSHIYGLSFGFSQSVIFFMYAATFRFGAWLIVHDGMDPDLVFRVVFAIAFSAMSVGQAASFLPDYTRMQISAGHIFSIIDLVPKIDVYRADGKMKPNKPVDVKLHQVQFSYPTRPEVSVLKGVDMFIPAGQTVALVGQSGCGKSTIISLLQRYYDPVQGALSVDGVDVREYNLESLRSLMSVVSQEPVLFNTTIRENIVYGLPEGDTPPMTDVISAARLANAHNFISEMPQGYETLVGEKGTQLSGGQKQRIAIARALIRNPKILLLDEATSALDTHSEKVVQTALDRAREGRTCILIAHRLSTIQNADRIYAMENGRVLESGTHQELLARRGVYYSLVQGQQFNRATEEEGGSER